MAARAGKRIRQSVRALGADERRGAHLGDIMRLIDWLADLWREITARPSAPGDKGVVPPWEAPGRRVTGPEARERARPRPLPPWERDAAREKRLAEKQAEDRGIARQYGRKRRKR